MEFQTVTFSPDPITYIAPSWEELQQAAFLLSKQLLDQGKRFDRLITLAKGGWPLSRSLVDYLNIPEVASIGVKFYQGINTRYDKPVIYQDLPVAVKGERVLLFDDVADTGESLVFTRNYLQQQGVADITTATLFYKPRSKYMPDVFGAQTESWIVFPFETVETIKALGKRWKEAGVANSVMLERFQQLGFAESQVVYFLK